MTETEKINNVITLCGIDVTQDIVTLYLADAKEAILRRIYGTREIPSTDIPQRYEMLQCKLASRYILRRGAEGEILHSENGINRTYKSVNDEDLLCEVMQCLVGIAK